jgi:hypothetical protein
MSEKLLGPQRAAAKLSISVLVLERANVGEEIAKEALQLSIRLDREVHVLSADVLCEPVTLFVHALGLCCRGTRAVLKELRIKPITLQMLDVFRGISSALDESIPDWDDIDLYESVAESVVSCRALREYEYSSLSRLIGESFEDGDSAIYRSASAKSETPLRRGQAEPLVRLQTELFGHLQKLNLPAKVQLLQRFVTPDAIACLGSTQ